MPTDPYEVLGVTRTAPDAVIKAAYRARIREAHPDAGGNAAEAQAINDAWATLSDPVRRAALDARPTPAPATPPTPGPRATPTPAQTSPATAPEPDLTFTSHPFPERAWWRSPWIWASTAGYLAAGALGADEFGIGPLFAVVATVLWWMHGRDPRLGWWAAGAAVIPPVAALLACADGTLGTLPADPSAWLLAALPLAAFAAMAAVGEYARARWRRLALRHAGDVFLTTSQQHGLTHYVIADITAGAAGTRTAHLRGVDEPAGAPVLAVPLIRPGRVGDLALAYDGRILHLTTVEAVRLARRRR